MIFSMQFILLTSMLWTINMGFLVKTVFKVEVPEDDEEGPKEMPFILLLTKVICSLILHVIMQPKVDNAIRRLYFIKNHPDKFSSIGVPITICFMKLLIEFSTELINMVLTAVQQEALEVVFNYLALIFISNLDEVYYSSINTTLKQQLEEKEFQIPIEN
mmetsp:Transcript_16219/g.27438  ORF Transcript_16219/g.27438 Transcript_16219/m.27438 type:complete len:160 (-) Transcript_16219:160-639(-)